MSNLPKVTVGFVNCNRLFYLKSCVESFLETTQDYDNKELIIVDNASIEKGTDEYLSEKAQQGITVIKTKDRDPSNEYAKALNIIVENSTGDYIAPLPADTQFVVRSGWLEKYVKCMEENPNGIGCITFDAQRTIRNSNENWGKIIDIGGYKFRFNPSRNPILGAANCLFSRKVIDIMYPWEEKNSSHEGGQDSETKMLNKVRAMNLGLMILMPVIPTSIGIYNEQGTSARIRGDKRIGIYFEPKQSYRYYEIHDYSKLVERYGKREIPIGIEYMAKSIGWNLPLKKNGEWIKLSASESDKQPTEYI